MYDVYSDSNDDDHSQSLPSTVRTTRRSPVTATIDDTNKLNKIARKSPRDAVKEENELPDAKIVAKITEIGVANPPSATAMIDITKSPFRGKRETIRPSGSLSRDANEDMKKMDSVRSTSPILIHAQTAKQSEQFKRIHKTTMNPTALCLVERQRNHCKLNQERFDHYSYTCHLFPRLSQSNLQFHDINWYKEAATNAIILRKRHVCVNKLVKSMCIHLTDHQILNMQPQKNFRANFSLLDRRPFAKRQIVSNICSIQIPIVEGNPVTRVFRKIPTSNTLLIRSNYRQHEVALQIIVESIAAGTMAIVGRVELDLLDGKYKIVLGNRTHSYTFDGGIRIEFDTVDVPQREQLATDSLPDVLICDERWIPMLAIYRQLLCERLAEDGDVFADRTTWIVDPVIATFTTLLDTDQNATDLLLLLMTKYEVFNELIPSRAVDRFRFVYMKFMLPFLSITDNGNWREQLMAFANGRINKEPEVVKAFSTVPCRSLDIYEYVINLCGTHSID